MIWKILKIREVYKSTADYSPGKKVLIVCDDVIADMISKKIIDSVVTELKFSLVFIAQSSKYQSIWE